MAKCRCCGAEIKSSPLLQYKNMPGKAQHFPDKTTLSEDRGVDLDIYECESCGLIQLTGEPVSYYRDVIRAAGVSDEMRKFRIGQFADFIEKNNLSDKKIIEIGCGNGEFMQFMKAAGGNVCGLENSEEAVKHCNEIGLDVMQGFPEGDDFSIPGAQFDAFYIMNFLEHIPDPRDFLYAIGRNLQEDAENIIVAMVSVCDTVKEVIDNSDGSYGLIEVPNMDMIIESMLFSEFMLDHLSYFTKETLAQLLSMCGFEVISCESVWHDYCLSAVVRKRRRKSLDAFLIRQDKLVKEIREYIDGFNNEGKRVAIWGAGHEALAIMALSDLGGKIQYVIDSADFKQNKYTPGSHIPVFAPGRLIEEPVDAIIVMAGSYSDEVKKIIKRDYNTIKIAVSRENGLEICKND